jgi:hypothetical protein
MSTTSGPDLVKITEVFLIPSSFLVAALGTADTNPHRAGVSLVGLVVSVMWWVGSWEALTEWLRANPEAKATHPRRIRVLSWLPPFFVVCWAVSVVIHILLWNNPLGH